MTTDIVKAKRLELKARDKDRTLEFVKVGGNLLHALLENEVVLALLGFSAINVMIQRMEPGHLEDSEGNWIRDLPPKFPWLSPLQGVVAQAGVIGIALAKSGAVENIGDAVGKIRGSSE